MTCECGCEPALARILLLVDRRGDGESLDGRDPQTVVGVVEKRLGVKQQRSRARVRPVSKRRAEQQKERRNAEVAPAEERCAIVGSVDPSFRLWVSQLACAVGLLRWLSGVDPCHLKTKRNAGDWIDVDGVAVGNIFPAERHYHVEQHTVGIRSFAERHGLDLEAVCRVVGEAYLLGLEPADISARARRAGGYQHVCLEAP